MPSEVLKVSNPKSGSYLHIGSLRTLAGPVPIKGSWVSVDVATRGKSFRLLTTHLLGPVLDGSPDPLLPDQAQEVLDGPAKTDLPVILLGDLNSAPDEAASSKIVAAGFVDEWAAINPNDPGFTAFQDRPGINNPVSKLGNRIDYIFARGGFTPLFMQRIGADPSARTASGLWPSDHAGLVAKVAVGP